MDSTFIEPLVRRAMKEKFPDILHSIMEVLKRIPAGGIQQHNAIPGIGESLSDAIRQLIMDNIFTVKGMPMDPISELDVIQRLAETLERSKNDFIELVFPADNVTTHDLFCKLVSYAVSMKMNGVLKMCTRYIKTLDLMHMLRQKLVGVLRQDFCQVSQGSLSDLAELSKLCKELAAVFVNTLCTQMIPPVDEVSVVSLVADWLANDIELMGMVRPQTSNLIRWCLSAKCLQKIPEDITWKLHLAILQGFQYRATRGKKHAFLGATDVKAWQECLKGHADQTAADMFLQLVVMALQTQAVHLIKEELDVCLENIPHTDFYQLVLQTNALMLM